MHPAGDRWLSSDCEMVHNCTAVVQKLNSCGTLQTWRKFCRLWPLARPRTVSCAVTTGAPCFVWKVNLNSRSMIIRTGSDWGLRKKNNFQVLRNYGLAVMPFNQPHFDKLNPFQLRKLWNLVNSTINSEAMFTIWPGNWNERSIRRRRRLRVSHES